MICNKFILKSEVNHFEFCKHNQEFQRIKQTYWTNLKMNLLNYSFKEELSKQWLLNLSDLVIKWFNIYVLQE